MLAKRRAINAFHRRERSPDIELNESELYGGGDDFQSRYYSDTASACVRQLTLAL